MESLPPWELLRDLLRTLILPSVGVSALLLVVMAALAVKGTWGRSVTGQLIIGAMALGGGMVAGNFLRGLLPWWSIELGWPALFPATLAALVGTVLAMRWSSHFGPRRELALRSIVLAGVAYWLAPGDSSASRLGYFALLLAASLGSFEVLSRLDRTAQALPRTQLPLAITVIWGGSASTVLVAAQSARFSEMAVLLAASFFCVGLAALSRKVDAPELLIVPSVFYPALMLNGQISTYSEVPFVSFILIAFAPCVLVVLRWPAVRSWPALARQAAIPCAFLLPCALGVFLALRAEPLDFSEH